MCYFPVNYFIVLLPTKYLFIIMQISEYDITNENLLLMSSNKQDGTLSQDMRFQIVWGLS
jgi:hypothetical protein